MAGTPKEIVERSTKQSRYMWLVAALALAVVAGIWYAASLPIGVEQTTTTSAVQETIVSEITLGALRSAEEANDVDPPLVQKPSYTTSDQLVLRITTAPEVERLVELNARLLTPAGEVVELDPSVVQFSPGTSGFCCWQVEEPGEYTLQIFRPERTITSIPLKIIKGFDTSGAGPLSL